jgi:dipeptidyl aminopeptidase/acylaminoacyl peptidase
MATTGDGYYFWTPMPLRLPVLRENRRLYRKLLELSGARAERVEIAYSRGKVAGLLHWPGRPTGRARFTPGGAWPALVVLHPLGGDKELMDRTTQPFREAGFVTLAIDLPAHGEGAEGPRLWAEAEECAVAALELLAARRDIDAGRLGILGGSLGAFFSMRAAAATRLAKVCVAFAAPYDIGAWLPHSVSGLQDSFVWILGASSRAECFEMVRPFHLRDTLGRVNCPVFLGHGTLDHFVFFTTTYEVSRQLAGPVTVQPYVGADHEVALPRDAQFAEPAVRWLTEKL